VKNKHHIRNGFFSLSRLTMFIVGQCALSTAIFSGTVHSSELFDPAFIESINGSKSEIDLSAFNHDGGQAPGSYQVDIYLNKSKVNNQNIYFNLAPSSEGKSQLIPCIPIETLREMGVKVDNYPQLARTDNAALNEQCANLAAIPQASSQYEFNQQRLMLSIPLIAIDSQARGYIPPSRWDQGIPALLLNYSISGSNSWNRNSRFGVENTNAQYINLRPGLNLGAWRLRNYSSYSGSMGGEHNSWQSAYTYVQRDIATIKSQLVMGQSYTSSDIFDTVPFTGVQVESDESMSPDSLSGYAPTIRAIARTNAQVTITQLGYTIAQKYVPPGEFIINDLNPTSASGDLTVTIKEEDGTQQVLIIPYAGVAQLQREGNLKYSITSGQYRSSAGNVAKTPFSQVSFGYGLPGGITTLGGMQTASKVQTLALGLAKNLGAFGAVSWDVTQSWSTMQNDTKHNGQSWRIRYNKNLINSKTNVSIAGYRYSTAGYYSLSEVLDSYGTAGKLSDYKPDRRRNRSEFMINQGLWEGAGSLSLNFINQDYWGGKSRTTSVGASYYNSWKSISYGISYSESRNVSGYKNEKNYSNDRLLSLNISIPFDWGKSRLYSTYSSTSNDGRTSHRVGINGSTLQNKLSWSMQQGYSAPDRENSGGLNSSYQGTYGRINAGYSYGSNQQSVNYGLDGALLGHENGVTLSQRLGETSILVETPQAAGIAVSNQTGVETDYRGYTVIPYAQPYRLNTVRLKTDSLPDDIELLTNSEKVVPTRGAVARVRFAVDKGRRVLMTLTRDNQPVPFGALVSDLKNRKTNLTIVGDRGEVYLTGLSDSGQLRVSWGKKAEQQCTVNYQIPEKSSASKGILALNESCR